LIWVAGLVRQSAPALAIRDAGSACGIPNAPDRRLCALVWNLLSCCHSEARQTHYCWFNPACVAMVCAIWRGVPVIAAATGFGAATATFFASAAGTTRTLAEAADAVLESIAAAGICSDATPPARPSVCIVSIDAAVPALSFATVSATFMSTTFARTAAFVITPERLDVVVVRPTTVAVFSAAMRLAPIVLGADVGSPAAAGACAPTLPSKHNARTAEIVVVPTIAPGAGIRLIGMSSFREQACEQ
jgi:hypothetical protein